ncbi:MAG: endolytic transglycosylase MltG [Bacteroidetes bacterium]|nr:endolytic transglycosylase MltG [Bacteroidota bacterium]
MSYYHPRYGYRKKKSTFHRFIIYSLAILIIAVLGVGYFLNQILNKSNVWVKDGEKISIIIPTGSTFGNVKSILYQNGLIIHRNNFEWLAYKKKYDSNVKAGKYLITNGMSNNELINHLRSGNQQPVKLIFNNIRDIKQLSKRVSEQIEPDSISIMRLLNDSIFISDLGFNANTIPTLFIPNTYEVFWNVSPQDFINRMLREYNNFWNSERKAQAKLLNMSIPEVIILASILERETQKNDEKETISGVYLNRLRRGWLLQADPTLIYALGDFSIKRVLNIHKEIDSPYNTYKYGGLPPGPICIPAISSIDAVLKYEQHDYMYFCARDDFSGYHVFAKTNRQHNRNAEKYRDALNKLRIWK